jgi:hypothetical protein
MAVRCLCSMTQMFWTVVHCAENRTIPAGAEAVLETVATYNKALVTTAGRHYMVTSCGFESRQG